MNRDWNFDTVWLYDKPQSALWQLGNNYAGYRQCIICQHIYNASKVAQWKVGYSCLSSMEVFVIGYCDQHYAYLQPELDAERVRCSCQEEAGIIHNFEEIIVGTIE